MDTLQDRLREAMAGNESRPAITPAEIAEAAGVSRAAVSVWFTREPPIQKLSSPVLLKVAERCGVRPEWLATGKGPMRATGATAVAESRPTYFGVPNSREEAELGREWGKIADDEVRAQVRTLIYLLVAKQEQEKRAVTKPRRGKAERAQVAT